MKMQKIHWIGIICSVIVMSLLYVLMESGNLFFIFGMGFLVVVTPFVYSMIRETNINSEKEEMFLEFARNLVESVKTGTPINKSIINIKNKSYGALEKHVKKLSNQISLGVPLSSALQIFSKDVNNKTISRALTLIGQAERAGGDIGEILESVAGAVNTSDKLKKERKAAISTLVAQGYIIFLVFMVIILVMQFKIFPMVAGISGTESQGLGMFGGAGGEVSSEEMANAFLYLLLIQGFFNGLTIGKLAEGNVKSGLRHSFILMLTAFLISTGANIFFT